MIDMEVTGLDNLIAKLERLEKKYPIAAENAVDKESAIVKGLIRVEVDRRTKGHGSEPETLKRRFKVERAKTTKGTTRGEITTTAPHYHLVEEGHDSYAYPIKTETGVIFRSKSRKTGEVKGRKIVAKVMAVRSKKAEELAERVLKEVLDEIQGN